MWVAAKNLILAGVKSVTLHDEGTVELWDLSSNFCLSEGDIGKNRALACVHNLQELNNAVLISTLTAKLSKEQLSDYQVGVLQLSYFVWKSLIYYNLEKRRKASMVYYIILLSLHWFYNVDLVLPDTFEADTVTSMVLQ